VVAYRLPGERVPVTVEDGPTIEVEVITAYPIYVNGVRLAAAFDAAKPGAAEITALRELYAFFAVEAQPTWEITDHRGPIPNTAEGMWRLPLAVAFAFVNGWLETANPKPSAVDAMIPPGPLRDELNAGLRKARKTKVD
jgi:hypothetical protein